MLHHGTYVPDPVRPSRGRLVAGIVVWGVLAAIAGAVFFLGPVEIVALFGGR